MSVSRGNEMIRQCYDTDFEGVHSIINHAARKYKGVIPDDCWKVPYMSREELKYEIENGILFWGYEINNKLIGVMGIQDVQDVTLIRHAYVSTAEQGRGIGGKLLSFLCQQTNRPVLLGTWADAIWAIRFYAQRGFSSVSPKEKDRLLKKYWVIPERQAEVSVVLADETWFDLSRRNSSVGFTQLAEKDP
jgi:N-acetylglutamate synthase-like GNAT family acetyltransferase